MKSALLSTVVAAAFALTLTAGCAPPAPPEVDISTEPAAEPAASSNMTSSAESPDGDMTPGADAPAMDAPAE